MELILKQLVGEPKEVQQMVDSSNLIPIIQNNESLPMLNPKHDIDQLLDSSFLDLLAHHTHHKQQIDYKRQANKLSTSDFVQVRLSLFGVSCLLTPKNAELYEWSVMIFGLVYAYEQVYGSLGMGFDCQY